ncbi:MAG: hypothetical protein WCM76_07935 [Bacteroidota bacterium]
MLKKVLTYFFAVVFLLSVTGVSLQLHTCLSAGKTNYSFYPEYFGAKKSCCCAAEKFDNKADNGGIPEMKEMPCCSNNHILYKIPTFQNQRAELNFVKVLINIPGFTRLEAEMPVSKESLTVNEYRPPPPTFTGLAFLKFSHNYKIPAPVS